MKRTSLLMIGLLATAFTFAQEIKKSTPSKQETFRGTISTELNKVPNEHSQSFVTFCQELGVDHTQTSEAEINQAMKDLHVSDPVRYSEVCSNYATSYNGSVRKIKRADFEKLPDERKKSILEHPELYLIVD